MASILDEIAQRLAAARWLPSRVGSTPDTFAILLGWGAVSAYLDELPVDNPGRAMLAGLLPPMTGRAYLGGFAAGLRVLEHLDSNLPQRGIPGLLGAMRRLSDERGEQVVAEAKVAWDTAKEFYPSLGGELDLLDEDVRKDLDAHLHEQGFDDDSTYDVIDVAVGFANPALPRTPSRSGFILAFMWREYVAGRLGSIVLANQAEADLVHSYEATLVALQHEGSISPRPVPWPRDLRCVCGADLSPSLFCCDPRNRFNPAMLRQVDERMMLGPCQRCDAFLPGFVCDACGTPNAWTHGVVPTHRP